MPKKMIYLKSDEFPTKIEGHSNLASPIILPSHQFTIWAAFRSSQIGLRRNLGDDLSLRLPHDS